METQRSRYEELEIIEDAISDRLMRNPDTLYNPSSTHNVLPNPVEKRPLKEILLQQHEIEHFLEKYKKICRDIKIFEPTLKDEVKIIKNSTKNFEYFKTAYDEIMNDNDESAVPSVANQYVMGSGDDITLPKSILSKYSNGIVKINSIFSVDEQYGQYLDLLKFYESWLNLITENKVDATNIVEIPKYVEYISLITKFDKIPKETREQINTNSEYSKYVSNLSEYLRSFYEKTNILQSPNKSYLKIKSDFDSIIWPKRKQELTTAGLTSDSSFKCLVCDKAFSKETVYKGHLASKKHIKKMEKIRDGNIDNNAGTSEIISNEYLKFNHDILLNEYLITSYAALLDSVIKDTRLNIQRRNALTNKERFYENLNFSKIYDSEAFPKHLGANEKENDTEIDKQCDQEDDDEVYNPMNLPLDVDGKPIPFWLWKLQGLDHEYTCEICGNFKYHGRNIFERHFKEQRHIYGLQCLGIPQTKEMVQLFKDVIKINDAIKLWGKFKMEIRNRSLKNEKDNIVEVEDDEGNVMTQKVYTDLQRQGLL